ncbi:uncharacterized protein LOC122247952 isoform X2 [Penaeus japonicus]|nr:uncharacterized protein LOC122247952 isoform X2 [Penaeus japonicus]
MVAMYNNDMEGADGRPSDEDVPERDVPPSAQVAEDEGPAKSGGHDAAARVGAAHEMPRDRAEEDAAKYNEQEDDLSNLFDEDLTSNGGATGNSASEGPVKRSEEGDAATDSASGGAAGEAQGVTTHSEVEPQPGNNSDDSASDDTIRGCEDGAAKGNDEDDTKENVDNTLKESDEESDVEDSEDEDAARDDDDGAEWLLKIDDLDSYKKAMIPEHFYLRISSPRVLAEEQLRLALDRLLGDLKWLRLGLKHRQGDCWICYLPKATMQVRICNDDSLGYIMEEPQRSHYYLHNDLLCTVHILADPQVARTTRGRRRGKKVNNNGTDKGDSASVQDRNPTRDYIYLLLMAGPPPLLNETSSRLISDTFVKHLNDVIEESVAREAAEQRPSASNGVGEDLGSSSGTQNPSATPNDAAVPTGSGISSDDDSSKVSVTAPTVAEGPKEGVCSNRGSVSMCESSAEADSVSKQDKNMPSDTEVCSGTDSVNVSSDSGCAAGACSNDSDKKEISLDEIQDIKTFLSEFQINVNNDDLRFGGENSEENEDDDTYGGVRKLLNSYVNKCFMNKCKAERVSYFNAFVACVNAAAVKLLVDAGLESDREVTLFHKVSVRFPWPRQEWWTDRDDDGNEDNDDEDEDDEDDYTSSGQERSAIKVSTVPRSWQPHFWQTAQTVNSKQWEAADTEKPEMPRKIRPASEEEVGETVEGPCVADIHLSVPSITETFEWNAQRHLFKTTTIRKLTFLHQFLMTFNINLYIDAETGNLGFYLNHSTVFNSRAIKIRFAELILAVLKRSLQL